MKKQKPHYVNNKDFTQAIVEYKKLCSEYQERNEQIPHVPNYIAESILKISEKLSRSSNFIGYTYREEMVMDAVENCLKVIKNYDIDKATRSGEPNAFGYFTQIAYYAFLRRIQKENRQIELKMNYIETATVHDVAYSEDLDEHLDNSFIEKLKERVDIARINNPDVVHDVDKNKIKKPVKKTGLEHFLVD